MTEKISRTMDAEKDTIRRKIVLNTAFGFIVPFFCVHRAAFLLHSTEMLNLLTSASSSRRRKGSEGAMKKSFCICDGS